MRNVAKDEGDAPVSRRSAPNLTFIPPTGPPTLTPRAATALLKLMTSAQGRIDARKDT